MNGRAYGEDLGAGVYETDDPAVPEAGAQRPREAARPPTCPNCGSNDSAAHVHHPNGEWWCSVCNHMFHGTEHEWHVLSANRRKAVEKRAQRDQQKEAT